MKIPARIVDRVKELRAHPTNAESALRPILAFLAAYHDIRLVFQQPFRLSDNSWIIVDWVCPQARLAFEADGRHHQEDKIQRARDRDRDEHLLFDYGVATQRLTNAEIADDTFGSALRIVDLVLERLGKKRREGREKLEPLFQDALTRAWGLGL